MPAKPEPPAAHIASIKTLLEFNKQVTSAQVQEHLKCDSKAARHVLKHLVETGFATYYGQKRGTSYRLAGGKHD